MGESREVQFVDRPRATMVERAEADAWADIQAAAPAAFRARLGIEVRRLGGVVATMARHLDSPGFNRVFTAGVSEPLTGELLDELIAYYREAGVPRFVVHWSPHALPAEAPAWLLARGFRAVRPMAKLCRRAGPTQPAPTTLRLVEIDASAADTFAATVGYADGPELAPGYRSTVGRPGWRHYLALDGERPVSGAAVFVRGDVAWCGFGATLPADRGRGAHSALLARRVHDAAAMGCRWVVCETLEDSAACPNPSYRNMRRAGFELVHLRATFLYGGR